jgi:regulator of ribosome biosynthesis
MAAMEDVKPQPLICDLGHLLCSDPNPLPSLKDAASDAEREAIIASTARDCAQTLINQLLTNCPIKRDDEDGTLQITLPKPEMQLPREKPVPKEKEKTRWEKFADKKGIQKKRKDGKLVYDEAKGDWVPKYGYKGKNTEGDGDWLVEVDEKAEREAHEGARNKKAKKAR